MPSTPQKMLAEFVGTFALIFIGAGTIMAFTASNQGGDALAAR